MAMAVVVAGLTAAAFAARLAHLHSSAEPFGTDGYYYVVQVERLLSSGHLHVPDGSWVLPLLAAVATPFRDPIGGVKVGAALLAALCVPAAWLAGSRLARGPEGESRAGAAGLALAAWATLSPTITQLAAEFPKALGVVPPLLVAAGLAASRPRGRTLILLAVALLVAATAHRLGAAFAALGLAGAAMGALSRRREAAGEAWRMLVIAAAAAGTFAAASAALPNLLHPADLERLHGHVRVAPGWPPPVPYLALRAFHPAQILELALPWAVALLAAAAWVRGPSLRPAVGMLAAPLAVCLVPMWRDDVLDLGYRLCLMAPLAAAPLAAAVWPRASSPLRPARAVGLAGLVAALSLVAARTGADPAARPPYERYRRILAAIPRPLPPLVIAHTGMTFLYDHESGRDAMAWAPEPELDRRLVWRVAWGIRPGEWAAFAPAPAAPVVPLGREYAWVREDVWEAFVARARSEGDDDLSERLVDWRNPSAVRPQSLARNHRR